MNGYGGNILRVNLSTGTVTREPTPVEVARDFIGGRGFGIYFLLKEVPKGADPLGPENKLIISSGPISGMMIPGGGKCDWTTKAPLTGGYASDLLSDVMANSREGDIWVTLQVHPNIIAVASLKDLAGIVIVQGKKPEEQTVEKAQQEGVPLLVSELQTFEIIGRLYNLGISGMR